MACGYRYYACLAFHMVASPNNRASLDRLSGYSQVLGQSGFDVHVIENSRVTGPWYTRGTGDAVQQLAEPLAALPHPLALFTFNDQAAYSAVEDLCAVAGLSRSLLDKRFRQVLKRSPLEEIHRQRIERVRQLLSSTGRSSEDIALETGFGDPFQMYKLFRKKTGMTPRQYRIKSRP
jgi:AraC-like DNA-binding protein